MTIDHVQIRSYFAPPAKSFWRWTEGGRVAGWKDELTIAFREELAVVLDRLAPRGLPPLGSVLLMLAACRDNWETPPDRRTLLHTHLGLLYGGGYSDLLAEVLTGLGRLYAVRDQHRASHKKAALAGLLFEDAPGRLPADKSQELAERFRRGLADEEQEWKPESALDDLLHSLGCLRWCLARLPFERLEFLLQTGLEQPPAPAPVEAPPPTTARELIATLQDDPELGAVARLAQLLLAAVQLPRAISDPDELPIGGVSDIANRGSLDRLLLSELANDDLTLAVRVAMNEALYLRRESPPRTPPRQRRLLLDAGLRTWGVPRVFVTAVGLAVAAKADEHVQVATFRSAGSEPVPIDLHSAAGLQAHLAALDHRLHPAPAAVALSRREQEDEEVETDLVLVTTDDTLADAEFQRSLHEAAISGLYLASVSRDGRFELTHKGHRGSKLICKARFDLDEILKPRQKGDLLDATRDADLPAFLYEREPPLRFSCTVDVNRSWLVQPEDVISYTRDGRLLAWNKSEQRGAKQIASGLVTDGNLLWCSSFFEDFPDRRLRLIVGRRSKLGLQAVELDDRGGEPHVVKLSLSGAHPREVIGLPGAILVFYDDLVEAVSWETGESLACRASMTMPNRHGRFFVTGTTAVEWHAIIYQPGHGEQSINSELVYKEAESAGPRLRGITRMAKDDAYVGLTVGGDLVDLASGSILDSIQKHTPVVVRGPFSLEGVSRDGCRLLVRAFPINLPSFPTGMRLLWDLKDSSCYIDNDGNAEQPMFEWAKPRVVHSRYRSVGVNAMGVLTLVSRRGQQWPILHEKGQRELRLPWQPTSHTKMRATKQFEKVEGFGGGFTLEAAEWPDGSRAWLDGRGLLHLRSADEGIPEATIVLCDGPMGGWISDGQTFGSTYWLNKSPSLTAAEVWDHILKPFADHLA